ncbi:MAG: metallophosphoesterase family protein, partial [Acidiferrobacterales bacterium]
DDCGCGFAEGSTCDLLTTQWYAYARRALNADGKAWMRELPRQVTFEMARRRLVVIHGGVSRINRFIFPTTATGDKLTELELAGTDGVIAGHSGVPFTQILNGRLWHNAGVIGLPANDGTLRVWYSILRPSDDGIAIEHHPLAYDHAAAARKMRERGLPLPYAEALETGIWPADDVMPEEDRRQCGRALNPDAVLWNDEA